MIPKSLFGKTEHLSTRTLFGAAALGDVTQAEADHTLGVLLEYGVNHIDVAASYGDAELRVGPWMAKHRDDFFLATKTGERTYAEAKAEIRHSLQRLQTDHVDLIQLHAVTEDQELDTILGPDGALKAAIEAQAQGLVRFIGITSHTLHAPAILMRAVEHFAFNSVLLPYNYPMMQIPHYAAGFNAVAKTCSAKNIAVQTIKSICRRPWGDQEHFAACWYEPLADQDEINRAVAFVLSHPAGLFLNTIGDIHFLPRVLEAASQFQGISPTQEEMASMAASLEMTPLWPEHETA